MTSCTLLLIAVSSIAEWTIVMRDGAVIATWWRRLRISDRLASHMDEETTVWEGTPSQVLNLHVFISCAILAGACIGAAVLFRGRLVFPMPIVLAGAAAVPIIYAVARWLQIRSTQYRLTNERLLLRRGILSRQTDEVELYRVKDYLLREPLGLRIFGLSDLSLATTDDANPNVLLRAVPNGNNLRDQFRKHVEICRQKKHVQITEFEG